MLRYLARSFSVAITVAFAVLAATWPMRADLVDGAMVVARNILPPVVYLKSHTLDPSDCFRPAVQMGTGSTGALTITWSPGLPNGCLIRAINADTTSLNWKFLSGFPSACLNSQYALFPGQNIDVVSINNVAQTTSCPGPYIPTAAMTLFVDTGGSDSTGDGTSGLPLATWQKCTNVYEEAVIYNSAFTQPTCSHTGSQTAVESVIHAIPITGTNTLNYTATSGVVTWKPSGANPYALFIGNGANVQLANITVSGTSTTCFSASCELLKVHNTSILELLAAMTCTDAGSGGFCIHSDNNTAGSAHVNIDNGLTLTGTIGTMADLNMGAQLLWNGTITASALTLTQVFGIRGAGTNVYVAGNFATSGSFGTARQWAVLNNAVFCSVSGTAIPGSTPGINSAATFAAGVIVNSGTSAGGC